MSAEDKLPLQTTPPPPQDRDQQHREQQLSSLPVLVAPVTATKDDDEVAVVVGGEAKKKAEATMQRGNAGKGWLRTGSVDGSAKLVQKTTTSERETFAALEGVETGDNQGGEGSSNGGGGVAATVYRTYKRRWFGLAQLTLLNIVVSWDWLTFSPVSQHAATYYNTTESVINWLATAFLFAFVANTPLAIWALHRGPKQSIVIAAVLLLVGNWVRYAGSHSSDSGGGVFGAVMAGQILCGLAQPFVLSAPTRYSDLWFTDRGRVAATALTSLANPFGAALGQLVMPFMVTRPSEVSSGVLYVSVIATASALPAFFVPAQPPTPPAPSCETPKASLRESAGLIGRSPEFWLIFVPFGVYVGFFNSVSSLLNQVMMPHGFTSDDAGIAGAVLIVVGLVCAAVSSPILDRTKAFLLTIKVSVPLIALSYLLFVFMPATRSMAGPCVVLGLLGASSFVLVPVALEYLVDLAHPVSPEVTSTLAWSSGQLTGGVFILISDALKAGADADPPFNMRNALIFTAVLALAVAPLPLCLGLFGRGEHVVLRRIKSDQRRIRENNGEI